MNVAVQSTFARGQPDIMNTSLLRTQTKWLKVFITDYTWSIGILFKSCYHGYTLHHSQIVKVYRFLDEFFCTM